MYFVLILLAVVAIIFALNKIRPDFIALSALSLLILSGTLTPVEALKGFGNTTVILVAVLFIVGKGLTQPGITQLIGDAISTWVKEGQENKLTAAVILAPIAINMAKQADISPYSLVMTLAIAASTAFLTPAASLVNMLVVGPGGYRFMDFMKNGIPLIVITFIICLLLIPVFFPFKVLAKSAVIATFHLP